MTAATVTGRTAAPASTMVFMRAIALTSSSLGVELRMILIQDVESEFGDVEGGEKLFKEHAQ